MVGGMHGRGCVVGSMKVGGVWQGAYMVGMYMVGGIHDRGCAWQGGMCGRGACVVGDMHGRGHAWQRACMVGRGCVWQEDHAWQKKWQLQRVVRILLECILVIEIFLTE